MHQCRAVICRKLRGGACSQGFSLIEVLVAVIVLAIGLVGGAALQLSALRTRHQSALLSTAVQLASSMADNMRANVAQMQANDASNIYLTARHDAARDPAPPAPADSCFDGAGCNSAQLANVEIYALTRQLRDSFPGGRLVICRDTSTWNGAAHGVDWACDGSAASPVAIKLGWHSKDPDGSAPSGGGQPEAPAVAVSVTTAAR